MARSGSLLPILLAALVAAEAAHAQDAGTVDAFPAFDAADVAAPGLQDIDAQEQAPLDGAEGTTPGALSSDTATRGTIDGLAAGAGERAVPLAQTGRVGPVQPYAERMRAMRRVTPLGGGGNANSVVFDGDTTRDAPNGIRVGSFLLYPELFTGMGWSDNRAGDSTGSAGTLYRIAPSVRLQSDWSRHSLGVNLRGGYTGYPDSDLQGDPNITADALLRLEVNDRTEVDVEANYGLALEDRGTAESSGGEQDIHEAGAGLALRRQVGLVGAELRGRVDSTFYSGTGGVAPDRNRDNALLTGTLRLEANTGAAVEPYAEASLLSRRYLERCTNTATCYDRNSAGYGLRAGVTFEAGDKLSGDVSVGWRSETPDDNRLQALEGMTVDGSLVWSPARLTTVTGLLNTTLSPSDLAGTPGSVTYSGDLRIAQGFSDALTGEVGVGYSWTDYTGIALTEQEARATSALTYALTSNVALQGRYTFRRFSSTTQGAGYSASEIEAGLRFRR
ncbi:outer membrane beta-barrel protein [Stappia sp.]|uniref:outer membrane beta-barrel protein n=1 Tax=Stappia sp. TaxID=1870903 RepID=UPI003A9A02BE